MKDDRLFGKFISRFVLEGLLKSVLCAISIGFMLVLVTAAVSLIIGMNLFWLSLGIFIVANGLTIPLLYYMKFRPTPDYVANRLDKLGLEERMVTMMENLEATSLIDVLQRYDALEHLDHLNPKCIRFKIPRLYFILAGVMMILAMIISIYSVMADVCCQHEWSEYMEVYAPTCSSEGREERKCRKYSSHTETKIIPVDSSAHDWGEWVKAVPATEGEDGREICICKNDSTHIKEIIVPATGTFGLKYRWMENYFGKGYAVSVGEAVSSCIYIPKTRNGLPVLFIDFRGFLDCTFIEKVEMPDSIVYIGPDAFLGCTKLKTVRMSTKIVEISTDSFCSCISLESIIIPESVVYIADYAFGNCPALKRIYYKGNADAWNQIDIGVGNFSSDIAGSILFFYSEECPDDNARNFWRFKNGVPTIWDSDK